MTVALAWLFVLAATDYAIPPGAFTIHPMSDNAVEREGKQTTHIPDPEVELALVSYVLPSRPDLGAGTLAKVGCSFTVNLENGTTSASADESKEPCEMGPLTAAVVDSLGKWKFHPSDSTERYWLTLGVNFDEGSTTAEVDVPQTHLASAMPEKPFPGLHVVSAPKARFRVPPKMPEGVKKPGGVFEVNCRVRFWLDEHGTPTDVKVEDCPVEFLDSLLQAAWQWRFDPYAVDGKALESQFSLDIIYKLR